MSGRAIALQTIAAALLAACMIAPAFAVDGKTTIDFGSSRIGALPEDFDFAITGQGPPGRWTVVHDATAIGSLAIEQSSEHSTEYRFPLAISRSISLKNLAASLRFKLIKGTIQTAGVVFRFMNADNYYVVGANALEGRVDLYRVLAGEMERIGGADAEVALNYWQVLGVTAQDDRFTISLDERPLFTVSDRTFLRDGRLGLWTEADTVARFDQLEITALPWSGER